MSVNTRNEKQLNFIKTLATYFMEFLETDFHKRRLPKRSIKLKTSNNLLVGLNIEKYPRFKKIIWEKMRENFKNTGSLKITKGTYKHQLPANISEILQEKIAILNTAKIDKLSSQLEDTIRATSAANKSNIDKVYSDTEENVQKIINKELVRDIMESVELTLISLGSINESDIYLVEIELVELIYDLIEEVTKDLIKYHALKTENGSSVKKPDIVDSLSLEKLTEALQEYFRSFTLNDLYTELYEIYKNKFILDKQEPYLYLYTIQYNNQKYPILYLPFEITKEGNTLLIDFDSQAYINKKAIEFVVQEYNKATSGSGKPQLDNERIIYLNNGDVVLANHIREYIAELERFFKLDVNLEIGKPESQRSRGILVTITNTAYVTLFDKSDEALVNDYESLLTLITDGSDELGEGFIELINDFIHEEPKSITNEIKDEWDGESTSDKLIIETPIPLNEEQRQILSAIDRDECKYISVEGPPGTGKSHTITAIVFDAILKNRSVLVLSDKKEALDVVEDKITTTMDKVRFNENFQNPILRLGKTGNTYSQILSKSSIEKINNNYRAVRKNYAGLEKEIGVFTADLKELIEKEIEAYKNIDLNEVHELIELESSIQDVNDFLSIITNGGTFEELNGAYTTFRRLSDYGKNGKKSKLWKIFNLNINDFDKVAEFTTFLEFLDNIFEIYDKLHEVYGKDVELIKIFGQPVTKTDSVYLKEILQELRKTKKSVVGYLFSKKETEMIDLKFKQKYPYTAIGKLTKAEAAIEKAVNILEYADELKAGLASKFKSYNIDIAHLLTEFVLDGEIAVEIQELSNLHVDLVQTLDSIEPFKEFKTLMEIKPQSLHSLKQNKLTKLSTGDISKLEKLMNLTEKYNNYFKQIPFHSYYNEKRSLEELATTKMTYLMDKRVVDFYEEKKNTAVSLRNVIKNKRRFDKDKFEDLKEAFPCILAGIRDYAEYIPLEPGLFDLVVIDEASQVSIAQSFPALLRGKKVVVFGDNKQFSNIKAALARSDTNQIHLNNLRESFKNNVSNEQIKLERLSKFNIKTSILDFFYHIANFNIQLKKHFRGYPELISYSNKYFYEDSLEVMKIRGKPIDEVLSLSVIEHDNKLEIIKNTNALEAEYILNELANLKEQDVQVSVGIITPHTNQQRYIWNLINLSPNREYYIDNLNLKVMTFDTCQGEERDIIFYSMVATDADDKLNHIFIKDLNQIDYEDDSSLRAQRLNVGLSRAKESIKFILSKDSSKYRGAIGEAIRHYQNVLDETLKNDVTSVDTDQKSPMESKVLNYLKQSEFYKSNNTCIEIKPQFELGKYLKQLDPLYNHPDYVVDFLIIYRDGDHKEHKLIIEYDGFEYHFIHKASVNKSNYDYYYREEDVYREKILESYGYRFLRLNRFNLTDSPIKEIDAKLKQLLNDSSAKDILNKISTTYGKIEDGKMRECKKCGEYKDLESFRDNSLITKYGRFCMECKGVRYSQIPTQITASEDVTCPRCKAKMILRNGKYGMFYGCSTFPRCRGTRPYK